MFIVVVLLSLLPLSLNTSPPQLSLASGTYYLRTVSSNPSFNALYLQAYQTTTTFPGYNDAVIAPRGNPTSSLATGFLTDDTYQQFDLGSSLTWTLQMTSSQEYDAWHSVQINAGMNTQGFYFNNTDGSDIYGLKWVNGWPYVMPGASNDFAGWLGMFISLSFVGNLQKRSTVPAG